MGRFKGEACLLLAALIWGGGYLCQKVGMEYIGPLTFNAFRFTLGPLVLVPIILLQRRQRAPGAGMAPGAGAEKRGGRRKLLAGGLLCGLTNFGGGTLQQVGIVYTTAGKAAFLSCMSIVIVPLMLLVLGQRISGKVWAGILLAGTGLYLLCINGGLSLELGDLLVILCAVVYSLQILLIDHFVADSDPLEFSFIQFFTAGILSLLSALLFETIDLAAVLDCRWPLLYAGIIEVGIGFTLQIVGQRFTKPSPAVIIMSLQSVFGAVLGMLLLGEVMSSRELLGCVVMFAGFLISQLPDREAAQGAPAQDREEGLVMGRK